MDKAIPTKQKILISAVDLFSSKGYTETSIREIAAAVGIKPASLYNHFSSKEDMLLFILEDYSKYTETMFCTDDLMPSLKRNSTAEGISAYILSSVSRLFENDFYLKVFFLIHQEQHHIDSFRDLILKRYQETMNYINNVFDILKGLNIISNDFNYNNYWGIIIFSLLYTISNHGAFKKKQNIENYNAVDNADLIRYIFEVILKNKPSLV